MPDRAHSGRGVHDPEMVRPGVDVELVVEDAIASTLSGALRLRNRDVGHAFPTYSTPRVFLELFQVDAEGREIPGTRVEGTIGREIDFSTDPWREIVDTRVFPGETVQLVYNLPRSREAEALVARAVVDPDYHYRGVFASLLETLQDLQARRLIEEATRRISTSTYVLAEMRRSLGAGE